MSNLFLKHNYFNVWKISICKKLLSVHLENEEYCKYILLHIVSIEEYQALLEKLMELFVIHAQVNVVDDFGCMLLHYALLNGHLEVINLILQG